MIKEVTDSGLRGRGGAAFPTGVKWGFLVRSPGPPKYILCNCEEGDPGAYNDKGILESDPYTLLEGMTIAGYATGSSNGFVFIRHGHDGPIDRTEKAIEQAYEAGLLGKNILGSDFSFDIEVSLTGESYVAGEETALMESIEGSRSMPRSRPPFPAAGGGLGQAQQHQQRQEPGVRPGDNLPRERVVLLVWRQPQHRDRDHLPQRRNTPPGAIRGADGGDAAPDHRGDRRRRPSRAAR